MTRARRIVTLTLAFAIGFFITFFGLNVIAWHGAKIVRPAHADEVEQSQEAQPEAKPEFKLPWKTFSEVASALNVEPEYKVCRNSGDEFLQYVFTHDGNEYSYANLNGRWAIWLYEEKKVVFIWLGNYQSDQDKIVPILARPAQEIKLIFPNICSWLIQPPYKIFF